MLWTDLITSVMNETYMSTDDLMAMVDDRHLEWKPQTGSNWMTMCQLLCHITNACGLCFQGFVTGDWGSPDTMDLFAGPAKNQPTVGSVAAARRMLTADMELSLRMLAEAGEDRLENEILRAPWDGPGCDDRHLDDRHLGDRHLGDHLLGSVQRLASAQVTAVLLSEAPGKDVSLHQRQIA